MSDSDKKSSVLITPLCRFAYVSIFSSRMPPNPKPGEKARYQIVGMFPPTSGMDAADQARMKALLESIGAVFCEKYGSEKFKALITDGKFGSPFKKDFATAKLPTEGFANYIRPWNHNPVGIVSDVRGTDGRPMEIKDPNKVFSGRWGRLLIHAFAYDADKKNYGVSFGLDGVQVIDGKAKGLDEGRLDNRVEAQSVFEADRDAPAEAMGQGSADDLAKLLGGA